MESSRLRVVIGEDSVLLREGLVELLTRFDCAVLAAVGDATTMADAVAEHRPDVLITDVRMPPDFSDEGLRAAVTLHREHPGLGVLVLTQYVATAYAVDLLQAGDEAGGGVGYLLKDRVGAVKEFIDALRRIAAGDTVIDPEVVRQLLRRERADQPLKRLTPRETEVLELMAEGRTNAAIAKLLWISEAAVSKNIGSIFHKLELSEADGNHRVLAVLAYLRG